MFARPPLQRAQFLFPIPPGGGFEKVKAAPSRLVPGFCYAIDFGKPPADQSIVIGLRTAT
jgi:hypothetical protein